MGTEQFQTFSQHFPTWTSGMNKQLHLTCRAQASSQTNKQDICNCFPRHPYPQGSTRQEHPARVLGSGVPWQSTARCNFPLTSCKTDPEATAVAVPGSKAKQPARLTEALLSTQTKWRQVAKGQASLSCLPKAQGQIWENLSKGSLNSVSWGIIKS